MIPFPDSDWDAYTLETNGHILCDFFLTLKKTNRHWYTDKHAAWESKISTLKMHKWTMKAYWHMEVALDS